MYLSKVDLDLKSPSIMQALRDAEDMHRNVQKYFSTDRTSGQILYRLRKDRRGMSLYLQSDLLPSETDETLRNGMHLSASKEMSAIENSISDGHVYMFNLLCMPCKKVADGSSKNSRRKYLSTQEERIQWLQRKGAQGGFQILSVIEKEGYSVRTRKSSGFTLRASEFQGSLKVTDEEKFKQCWRKGIGPEKAYGLGLLFIQ